MTLRILLSLLAATLILGCGKNSNQEHANAKPTVDSLAGDYVSDFYSRKAEGYDWVAVSVRTLTDSTAHIAVRSRADRKKPTCFLDADAVLINANTLNAVAEGRSLLFSVNGDALTIRAEREEDNDFLSYFCSGGASLAGTYRKINEPLDETQIDKTVFNRFLSLQNISFDISVVGDELSIQPIGLKIDNRKVTHTLADKVTNADIEDLNSDGFPEVLVYTTSVGSGSYGNVIAYSVNNGKSMSRIAFPDIMDHPTAKIGYMGHDEFAVAETSLLRRFPTYKEHDTNANPSGRMRQITYKLKEGEASRVFVIERIDEFDRQ